MNIDGVASCHNDFGVIAELIISSIVTRLEKSFFGGMFFGRERGGQEVVETD